MKHIQTHLSASVSFRDSKVIPPTINHLFLIPLFQTAMSVFPATFPAVSSSAQWCSCQTKQASAPRVWHQL